MMMIEQILGDADDNFANDSNASDDLGVCVDGEALRWGAGKGVGGGRRKSCTTLPIRHISCIITNR